MPKTLDLLAIASKQGRKLAELSRTLGVAENAISRDKHNGHLSPAMAAALAAELGEDPGRWAIVAAQEQTTSAPLRRKLAALATAGKSWLSRIARRRNA